MKKKIIIILLSIGVLFLLYLGVHTYLNHRVNAQYAQGFEKNPLGDYAKTKSGVVLAVYDAPLFQGYTNLSAHGKDSNIDIIIWDSLYSGKNNYGLVITDDEKKISHQIEVDENLKADNHKDNKLIQANWEKIDKIKDVVEDEWGLLKDN